MRRIPLLTLLALAVPIAASAQPDVRDHRAPPPPPDVRDHRPGGNEVKIRAVEPRSGAAGTTLTLRGELPPGAVVMLGEHKGIMPTVAGEHAWTLVVPDMPPGVHPVKIDVGGKLTEVGQFEVTAAGPPPGEPPMGEHHHREWKLERPVVSSYWPMKAKIGARIVIRGENFTPDTQVMWGTGPVAGAKVSPTEIVVAIPAGATTGMLSLHTGHGRDLPIGQVEVAAGADPNADWKRMEDERHKAAEQAWGAHEREIAKDKAAREANWKKWEDEQSSTREQRREKELAEYRAKWDREFLEDPEVQAEMTLHAQRMADIERMRGLAEKLDDKKLGVRIETLASRENDRHDQRIAALKATFKGK